MDLISYRPSARDFARMCLTSLLALGSITGCAASTHVSADELAGRALPLAAGLPPIAGSVVACPIFSTCFVVTNTNNAGAGSLRQAILDANAAAGHTLIKFDIPGAGKQVIRPLTYLPSVQGDTTIDGYSQPGALPATEATPPELKIVLDGGQCANICSGLTLHAGGNVVRGLVINDFSSSGIVINSDDNVVQGNILGTGPDMLVAVPNTQAGVNVNTGSRNLIGGPQPDDRNVISGNGVQGVLLFSDDNEVYGNTIGTSWDGTLALGNGGGGVEIWGDDNEVGGVGEGEANAIAYNGTGVIAWDGEANTFARNAIHDNDGLAIDLEGDGVTLNDGLGDADVGPNGLQNFPHITAVTLDSNDVNDNGYKPTVSYQLKSEPSTKYRFELYASSACDASGRGEAHRFLGSRMNDTDGSGLVEFTWAFSGHVQDGEQLSMLATKFPRQADNSYIAEDSSELGRCHEARLP